MRGFISCFFSCRFFSVSFFFNTFYPYSMTSLFSSSIPDTVEGCQLKIVDGSSFLTDSELVHFVSKIEPLYRALFSCLEITICSVGKGFLPFLPQICNCIKNGFVFSPIIFVHKIAHLTYWSRNFRRGFFLEKFCSQMFAKMY